MSEDTQGNTKVLAIPREVTDTIVDEIRDTARDSLRIALAKLAAAADDGRVSATEAGEVLGAVLDGAIDGLVSIADALLPLPEPYETLADMGIEQLAAYLRAESGPLEDLVELIVDALDGPEVEDIEAKIARHGYRSRVQGKRASERKLRKHAMRMLRLFPGKAAELGISGELGTPSSLKLDMSFRLVEGSDLPVIVPG